MDVAYLKGQMHMYMYTCVGMCMIEWAGVYRNSNSFDL